MSCPVHSLGADILDKWKCPLFCPRWVDVMSDNLTHHPDCLFWPDNENGACCCGLTGPAIGTLRPWTKQAMEEWRRKVHAEWQEILGRKTP